MNSSQWKDRHNPQLLCLPYQLWASPWPYPMCLTLGSSLSASKLDEPGSRHWPSGAARFMAMQLTSQTTARGGHIQIVYSEPFLAHVNLRMCSGLDHIEENETDQQFVWLWPGAAVHFSSLLCWMRKKMELWTKSSPALFLLDSVSAAWDRFGKITEDIGWYETVESPSLLPYRPERWWQRAGWGQPNAVHRQTHVLPLP